MASSKPKSIELLFLWRTLYYYPMIWDWGKLTLIWYLSIVECLGEAVNIFWKSSSKRPTRGSKSLGILRVIVQSLIILAACAEFEDWKELVSNEIANLNNTNHHSWSRRGKKVGYDTDFGSPVFLTKLSLEFVLNHSWTFFSIHIWLQTSSNTQIKHHCRCCDEIYGRIHSPASTHIKTHHCPQQHLPSR